MAPPKAAQVAEAVQRGSREIDNPRTEGHGVNADVGGDPTVPVVDTPVLRDPTDTTRPPPGMRPTLVDKRAAIIAQFREDRASSDTADDVAELRQFAHDGVPPDLRPEPEPEAPVEPETPADPEVARQDPEPETPIFSRRVKVRGQEVNLNDLSDDEILAAVQKGLAGDSYFEEGRRVADEAKATLERVNTMLAQQGTQGVRSPVSTERPGAEVAETPGTTDPEHPEVDPYLAVVEEIAYKDPKVAAAALKALIEGANSTQRIQPMVTQTLQQQRTNDELARSKAVRDRIANDRKDISQDPFAVAALQQIIAAEQLKDLRELGFEEHQLPKSREEIGKWHLHYRGEGMRVRSMETLFNEGVQKFDQWKGAPKPAADPGRAAPPRIATQIDRSERRTRIPQQPRTALPQRANADQPQPRDRSAVVQEMIAQRRLPRTPPPRVARQA